MKVLICSCRRNWVKAIVRLVCFALEQVCLGTPVTLVLFKRGQGRDARTADVILEQCICTLYKSLCYLKLVLSLSFQNVFYFYMFLMKQKACTSLHLFINMSCCLHAFKTLQHIKHAKKYHLTLSSFSLMQLHNNRTFDQICLCILKQTQTKKTCKQ